MVKDRKKFIIISLVIVIALLSLVLIYLFLVQPTINGLVIQGQVDGYNYAVQQIISLAVTCNPIPLTMANNQTINLRAMECPPLK